MSFIRRVFSGKSVASRRQHESRQESPPSHALDTLPALPTSRRPITPVTPNPQQLSSPFFKLPPELRQQIYRLLFSRREIHIDVRYTALETSTPHSTRGASFEPADCWRWRASTCHRHPDAQPILDRCGWGGLPPTACSLFDTPCVIGKEVLGLLLCCRLAYCEAVEVLYAENTFHITTGALVLYTDRLLPPERSGAVTSLIYQVTQGSTWDYATSQLKITPGLPAYEALLLRIPKAFPSLVRLLVVIQAPLDRKQVWEGFGHNPPNRDSIKDCLLSSMDTVVGGFGKPLVEYVLAMGQRAFDRLMKKERADAEIVESREDIWLQFWRPLSIAGGDKALNTGYWVRGVSLEE
ncbi:hypothetical protein MMYC01_207517 [Madurella mycetomatis]|uniref:DUF7730 domain-containing protein n=1 Tax=Madurella mycetomatis TaxID=100816 RepID=A0A175W0A1_9PEZI|nr:hypothetical protein MMYC01_207517 [Madurella mycetomatis]